MSLSYVTEERTAIPSKILSDPYMKSEIEQIDHNYTRHQTLTGWTRSQSGVCKVANWGGTKMVWLNPKSSSSTVDLKRTFNMTSDSEGWYRVYIKVRRGPTNVGRVQLNVNNIFVDDYQAYYSEYHWKFVDFGLVYLNSGSNPFKITLDKNIGVGTFFLYKVVKHDSDLIQDYEHKLDIKSLQFTQNSVTELNTIEMVLALKDSYYEEDSPSRFCFDGYTNAITLWMGEDRKSAKSMFGGYITGLTDSYSDDSGYTLTINGADRLLDFYREPVYNNFEVNTHVKSDDTKLFPYVYKHTIEETIRYLAETQEEGINTSGIDSPTVFYWNMGSAKQFNALPVTGFTKVWDKKIGHPAPGLRLGVSKKANVDASVILWDDVDNPFDANVDNILAFNYFYSSHGARYPTQFNIAIDMMRDVDSVPKTYYITFNGKSGKPNIIAHIKPMYNGKWNTAKIDLRNAFDNTAPGEEYNITGIRLEDTFNSTQVKNRSHTAIWLDNFTVYDDVRNVRANIDSEGSYTFEYFQKLCEAGDYAMWVDYGNERRDDVLVLASNYDDIAEISALPSNIIEIDDVEYNMRDYDVRNVVRRMYHPTVKTKKKVAHILKNKPSKKKFKVIYVKTKSGKKVKRYEYFTYKDQKVKLNRTETDALTSSYMRYRRWEHFEDMTDTTKEADAEHNAITFLNEHNEAPYSFSITMRGTTLLNPNQYLLVEEDQRRLTGLHKIKAITHNYDASGNATDKWQTQIDLGMPSKRFRNLVLNMKRNINNLYGKSRHITYTNDQLNDLGDTSPGAFI